MSARSLAIASSLILALTITSGPARAARYDLTLGNYFFTPNCDFNCAQQYFEDLMTELGQVSAPVFLATAKTLGLNGSPSRPRAFMPQGGHDEKNHSGVVVDSSAWSYGLWWKRGADVG